VRASCVLVVATGLMPCRYDELLERSKDAADAVIVYLREKLGQFQHDQEDSRDFLWGKYKEMLEAMEKLIPSQPKIIPDGPLVHYAHDLFPHAKDADGAPVNLHKFKVIEGGEHDGYNSGAAGSTIFPVTHWEN
jgi:hypothetical protein